MREPVKDNGRLRHMLDAIANVEQYTAGYSLDTLKQDKLRVHAVVYNVQIVGEAVYKLSTEFKNSHPDTQWRLIEKMRHILVHDYYQIDLDMLWTIIATDLPALKQQLQLYIAEKQ